MRLRDWAKQVGVKYRTAWNWFKAGNLPIPGEQMPSGAILVYPPEKKREGGVALYARVSSSDQKPDLDRQMARLVLFATEKKLTVSRSVVEVGSGLNGHRKRLSALLRDPAIDTIVVEHRERLARFGSEYIESALAASGRKLVVADATEMESDLVQDVVDVLTSVCARLYGRRAAKNRAKNALAAMGQEPGKQGTADKECPSEAKRALPAGLPGRTRKAPRDTR